MATSIQSLVHLVLVLHSMSVQRMFALENGFFSLRLQPAPCHPYYQQTYLEMETTWRKYEVITVLRQHNLEHQHII